MKKELTEGLVWAGGMLAVTLVAVGAQKLGYIERETVNRLIFGALGLFMAWSGNRIPKAVAPRACAAQAQRVAGWSLALSGLTYAGLWAFAPIPVATWLGTAVVLGGVVVTFGYCLSLQSRAKAG